MLFGNQVTTAFILLFTIGSAVNCCVSFTAFSQEIEMFNKWNRNGYELVADKWIILLVNWKVKQYADAYNGRHK